MTIDDERLQSETNREAAKISTLSEKIDKYEHITSEEIILLIKDK